MSTIVIYNSQTGFTKEYAEWIAEELGCQAVSFAERKSINYNEYDTIIIGSWLQAGNIRETGKIRRIIRKYKDKRFAVYATGCMPADAKNIPGIFEKNFPKDRFTNCDTFYFRGGLRYEKMTKMGQKMMAMLKKVLSGKKEPSAADKATLEIISNNFEGQDRASISTIIDWAQK